MSTEQSDAGLQLITNLDGFSDEQLLYLRDKALPVAINRICGEISARRQRKRGTAARQGSSAVGHSGPNSGEVSDGRRNQRD